MMNNMRALTIHQPWASCIVRGDKSVENREWAAPRDLYGAWLCIHAGKKVDDLGVTIAYDKFNQGPLIGPLADLPTGAIVGLAKLRSCVLKKYTNDLWATGPHCWLFDERVAFEQPIACRGYQRLWPVQGDLLDQVRQAYKLAMQGDELTQAA